MKFRAALVPLLLCTLLCSSCESLDSWLYENDNAHPDLSESPSPDPSPDIPNAPARSDLFGLPFVEDNIDPIRGGHRYNTLWQSLVYEGLFRLDASYQAQPALCARVTTEGYLVYHLTLRDDVLFHNGNPLSAGDVTASIELARTDPSVHAVSLRNIASIRAIDSKQIDITLFKPDPRFTALLTFPILPKQYETMTGVVPPGTGCFRVSAEGGQNYLTPNEQWWSDKPVTVTRVELISVTSAEKLNYALESQSVSLIDIQPLSTFSTEFSGDFEQFHFPSPDLHFLSINTASAFLSDARFRRAVAQAIEAEEFGLPKTLITPSALPVVPQSPLVSAFAEPAADANEVSGLLAEMGLTTRNEEGFLVDNAGRYERVVRLTLLTSSENEKRLMVSENIAAMLKRYGIDIEVVALPFAELTERLDKGEYDLCYGESLLPANFSPDLFERGGPLGYGGFVPSQALAELWDQYAVSCSQAAAETYWSAWLEEQPIIPLFFEQHVLLSRRGFLDKPEPYWGGILYGSL